jgi:hydroxyacylglutathione hydrolase
VKPDEVERAIAAGAVVLDLRAPRPFAAGHVPGALNMQFNRADLADRVEMVIPRGERLVVHAEPEPLARAAAGILREAGYAVLGALDGGMGAWRGSGRAAAELPLLSVDDLAEAGERYLVVDVREPFEYRHGHVPGAMLLPSGDAWGRLEWLPDGRPPAVICGDQTRSAFVAAMLLRAGRDAALVMGGMVDWLERGYEVERGPAPAAATP